ncbi:MAG: hydrogenase/urease nickel incorporation protein HypA [Campylobacter sp.]|nr:hydrogenase/urease nickel incorporation protein HypA [Campylobacter sp.]
MHEFSLVANIIELSEENAKKNGASKVDEIVIKVGKLSGVEPHYLESAFEFYRLNSPLCKDAKLSINLQNIVVECKECGAKSTLLQNEFLCPKCSSSNLEVIDGEDMYLMSLVMS